jgi:multisubunit Na+/H+ antiporter MnhE subunit
MNESIRTSTGQWLRTSALPLITLIAILGVTPVAIEIDPGVVLILCFLLAPLLVIASAIFLLRKATARWHAADSGLRTASTVSLAILFGRADLSLETIVFLESSLCKGVAADYCAFGLVGPVLVVSGVMLGICAIIVMRVAIASFTSAARARKWVWFAAILLYLIASVIAVVALILSPSTNYGWFGAFVDTFDLQSPLVLLALSPFLTPVLTLVYSLAGRAKSVSR